MTEEDREQHRARVAELLRDLYYEPEPVDDDEACARIIIDVGLEDDDCPASTAELLKINAALWPDYRAYFTGSTSGDGWDVDIKYVGDDDQWWVGQDDVCQRCHHVCDPAHMHVDGLCPSCFQSLGGYTCGRCRREFTRERNGYQIMGDGSIWCPQCAERLR